MGAALVRLYFDAEDGEGLAVLALEALARRHLAGLLARDPAVHTAALHEQLGGLQRVLAAVDPLLCMALRDRGLSPDMYAVHTFCAPPTCTQFASHKIGGPSGAQRAGTNGLAGR